jgi:predicted nucleic acid-binding protein
MHLLDPDILIDIQRGYPPAIDWFSGLDELPSVPGLVIMELIQNAQNKQKVQEVLKLVAPLPIVWMTETDCAQALSNFMTYHLSDRLGLIDSLIAACAVGQDATLCTFNVKHYRVVPNLVISQPYAR